jgi:hypothetical protein
MRRTRGVILSNSSTAGNGDARGWRMALVPDALLNPPHSPVIPSLDVLGAIEANGYGVLQLPPPGKHGLLLAVIADQIAEYSHHGYAVVAIGIRGDVGGLHWRRLVPLLSHRGTALPPRHLIRPLVDVALEGQRLSAFLSNYDLSAEERRRWRV